MAADMTNDTRQGPVEALVRRAMYVRSVSDGMDEIEKVEARARAIDQQIADLTRERDFARREAEAGAVYEAKWLAAERERDAAREALRAAERIFDKENGNEVWRHFDDADYQLVAAALRESTDTVEGGE